MDSGKIIKVCGMREGGNILAIDALGVDMIGFIFYPKSARFVAEVPTSMPLSAARVGVFVDESLPKIIAAKELYALDFVQLHGAESPAFVSEVVRCDLRVIKAFSIDADFDFAQCEPYEGLCEFFIFDTKCKSVGGSGQQFDWSQLVNYIGKTPFLLSGGISLSTVEKIKQLKHPRLVGYDLNSRFESGAGVKDIDKVQHFINEIRG